MLITPRQSPDYCKQGYCVAVFVSRNESSDRLLESIVLETDAAPQPFKKYRHNWTEPRHVREVAQKLADLKGIELEEVAQVTTGNLRRFLKLEQ